MSKLIRSPAWKALAAHQKAVAATSLSELFASDASRAQRFTLEAGGLLLDYSKHRVDSHAMRLLVGLAEQAQVPGWIVRMFAGEAINNTEGRAVLHTALRSKERAFPKGGDVMPAVRGGIELMRSLVDDARRGALKGSGGQAITDIVNIGIGGSDLGPRMLVRALRKLRKPGPRLHFVANVDPADLDSALAGLVPETTFFIIASKTLTTAETLENAARARAWLEAALGKSAELSRHFAAVTANASGVAALGVPAERAFPVWDWVGGRYSVWSAVGLPVALAAGMDAFEDFLEGGRAMDEHFRTAPLERNMPVLLALLEIWYVNFFGAQSRAVIPYSEDLRDLPAYLQQLEMESNGKRVDRDGNEVDYATAPVVWGVAGTPSQHSFHQLLHQGTPLVPVDFIMIGQDREPSAGQAALAANAIAQSAALAFGNPAAEPYKVLPGNRPSSTLLLDRLTPRVIGELIALYEHKVFVEGAIWNLNSFDQWGVEHGKNLARRLLTEGDAPEFDPSTRALLSRLRKRD
ncbi:MAG TPA: glucose-6-phosphate isomerase [Burkholderiales bacterium]